MRQVVMIDDVRELNIWPSELFDRYLELTKQELQRLILDEGSLSEVSCPACSEKKKNFAFEKFGLKYNQCDACGTLYVSPRPTSKQLRTYFNNSKAVEYWYNLLMTKTSKHRIKHQAKPRALWIVNFTDEYLNSPQNFLSITPSSKGFLKEIKNYNLFKKYLILNPYKNIAEAFSGKPDFEVIQNPLLETPLSMSVHAACAFGILDGVESPKKFLNMIRSTLVENGLIFLTTSTISGFDLQVLWEKSKDIFPPDRMNLLSIEGISILLKECGFEPIELSTPGQLDVEFVKNALAKDSSIKVPRFFSYLIHHRDEFTHRFFQEFLQQNKLSSHVRIAAQKK